MSRMPWLISFGLQIALKLISVSVSRNGSRRDCGRGLRVTIFRQLDRVIPPGRGVTERMKIPHVLLAVSLFALVNLFFLVFGGMHNPPKPGKFAHVQIPV